MVLLFMFQSQGFIPSFALATTEYFEVEIRLRVPYCYIESSVARHKTNFNLRYSS